MQVTLITSFTVLKTGKPRCVLPPFPGVVPPTSLVPYSSACWLWKVPWGGKAQDSWEKAGWEARQSSVTYRRETNRRTTSQSITITCNQHYHQLTKHSFAPWSKTGLCKGKITVWKKQTKMEWGGISFYSIFKSGWGSETPWCGLNTSLSWVLRSWGLHIPLYSV